MRRLHSPTLGQWTCAHQWKTTTSRPGQGDVMRIRYLTCRRCGLKVKTEERLAVPWDERDLVGQVKALLPEGETVVSRDKGITELALARLNAILARHGLMIHATKVRIPSRCVTYTNKDRRVERDGCFQLRRIPPQDHGASTEGDEGETAPRTAP